jgi:cob(I)alamin adenosyltransferase
MKIYTKGGDKGTTSLFGGKRVSKKDLQIEAYGTVDELNAHIGAIIAEVSESEPRQDMMRFQSILFDIGSHLASDGTADKYLPELKEELIEYLETRMDAMTAKLPELKSFILPGGNKRVALTHICRTVCRRAERRVVHLSENNPNDNISWCLRYLNRLSDYFFVLSRYLMLLDGVDEVKWNPK